MISRVEKSDDDIVFVTNERALEIIENRTPTGLFITHDGGRFIGIDNRSGDAWTEEFHDAERCVEWLTGQAEAEEVE